MRMEVVEQRVMRDRNSVREARRTTRILEIGDVAASRLGQIGFGRFDTVERIPRACDHPGAPGAALPKSASSGG